LTPDALPAAGPASLAQPQVGVLGLAKFLDCQARWVYRRRADLPHIKIAAVYCAGSRYEFEVERVLDCLLVPATEEAS